MILVCSFQLRTSCDSVIRVWDKWWNDEAASAHHPYFMASCWEERQHTFFYSCSIHKWQLLLNTILWLTKSLVSNLFSLEKSLTRWSFYFSRLRNNRYFKTSQLKINSISSSSHPWKVKGTHVVHPGSEWHVILIAWHPIDVTQKTSGVQLGNNLL